jgi:integrase
MPHLFEARQERRKQRALRRDEVYSALQMTWSTPAATLRNRALFAVAFYAGLRRGEIGSLQWEAIDFVEGTLILTGAKKREVDERDVLPLRPELVEALQAWQAVSLQDGHRRYVFCELSKAGKLLADKGISGESIRRIAKQAGFAPHDARRTLGTRAIEAGTPLNKVQRQLRHKREETTLSYAKYIEAKDLKDIDLGY